MSQSAERPLFYYDLGSPECYLVAEQIMQVLPVLAEWQPVLATDLPGRPPPIDRETVEREVAVLGLQPVRWPESLPADSRMAMVAATYAKQIGRGVAFSLAAFRQAFAAGRDLADRDTVLIAGAACEMHPAALLQALGRRSVAGVLAEATRVAGEAGVRGVPAIRLGGQVFQGVAGLHEAAGALRAGARSGRL